MELTPWPPLFKREGEEKGVSTGNPACSNFSEIHWILLDNLNKITKLLIDNQKIVKPLTSGVKYEKIKEALGSDFDFIIYVDYFQLFPY
jgi:hypothetical protein